MPGFKPSFLRHPAPIMPGHRRALCPVRRGVITGIRPYARYHSSVTKSRSPEILARDARGNSRIPEHAVGPKPAEQILPGRRSRPAPRSTEGRMGDTLRARIWSRAVLIVSSRGKQSSRRPLHCCACCCADTGLMAISPRRATSAAMLSLKTKALGRTIASIGDASASGTVLACVMTGTDSTQRVAADVDNSSQ
jgi:hypothetical protein